MFRGTETILLTGDDQRLSLTKQRLMENMLFFKINKVQYRFKCIEGKCNLRNATRRKLYRMAMNTLRLQNEKAVFNSQEEKQVEGEA